MKRMAMRGLVSRNNKSTQAGAGGVWIFVSNFLVTMSVGARHIAANEKANETLSSAFARIRLAAHRRKMLNSTQ